MSDESSESDDTSMSYRIRYDAYDDDDKYGFDDRFGRALMVACEEDNSDLVNDLIKCGETKINFTNVNGDTPFIVASRNGHLTFECNGCALGTSKSDCELP